MAKHGKRLRKAYDGIDRDRSYGLDEAVKLIKERAVTKFDETIEVSMNLGIDPRHADQNVRGVVTLPNGTGKSVRVAVFAKAAKAEEATEAGADPETEFQHIWDDRDAGRAGKQRVRNGLFRDRLEIPDGVARVVDANVGLGLRAGDGGQGQHAEGRDQSRD